MIGAGRAEPLNVPIRGEDEETPSYTVKESSDVWVLKRTKTSRSITLEDIFQWQSIWLEKNLRRLGLEKVQRDPLIIPLVFDTRSNEFAQELDAVTDGAVKKEQKVVNKNKKLLETCTKC